jgi:hypothetical protein
MDDIDLGAVQGSRATVPIEARRVEGETLRRPPPGDLTARLAQARCDPTSMTLLVPRPPSFVCVEHDLRALTRGSARPEPEQSGPPRATTPGKNHRVQPAGEIQLGWSWRAIAPGPRRRPCPRSPSLARQSVSTVGLLGRQSACELVVTGGLGEAEGVHAHRHPRSGAVAGRRRHVRGGRRWRGDENEVTRHGQRVGGRSGRRARCP